MRELDKLNGVADDASAKGNDAKAEATPGKAPLFVQRSGGSAAPSDPAVVQPIAERGVSSGGSEVPYRAQMEQGFGTSFQNVSFHGGTEAAASSRAIGADAYTMGNSIAMSATPTPHLVAHELAHVVQQQAGAGPSSGVGKAGDSFESEADSAASKVAAGGTSDIAAKYGAITGGMAGSIQRKAVQRYESGEHALLGAGPSYPVGAGDLTLPNGAKVFSGELVAFGDFYSDMVQLQEAPRQEVEALAGMCRLEAVWYQARRMVAQGMGRPEDATAGLVANQAAPGSGGNTLSTPAAANAPHPQGGPNAANLVTLPRIDGSNPIWQNANAIIPGTGVSVAACRQQIFNQFTTVWAAFNVSFDPNTLPETGVGMLRATIGRRRFRGTNDSTPRQGDAQHGTTAAQRGNDPNPWRPNDHEGPAGDPGHLGGDYLDLAQNNLAHFSPDNFFHWKDQHERACRAHAGAHDDQGRAMALASDNFGSHFLTDRFSTGHFVDKAELMTYATGMMVDVAKHNVPGAAKKTDDQLLRAELSSAVAVCFNDPSVLSKWEEGVNEAVANNTVTSGEGRIMRNLTHGMISDMITDVLMESPWRRMGSTPVEPENDFSTPDGRDGADRARGQGPNSLNRGSARADGQSYQLGVGNLAALQVHDALNAIGFTVENGMGDRWRCQGDDHLQQQTMNIANACVQASQAQVRAGASNPDGIKAFLPQHAWMDPSWIADYFQGQWAGAELDPAKISQLQAMVTGAKIDLNVDGGHRPQSDLMTRICHQIMEVLFKPAPTGPSSHEGSHGTGLNISMLKAFLIQRLGDMVSMAYAAASAQDIPQSALELYAPRDNDGHTLPRAANNFVWHGDNITFDLNTTGCAAGTYTLQAKCYNRDMSYDVEQTGMPGYSLVDAQERSHGIHDHDEEYTRVPIQVVVAAQPNGADPNAPVRQRVTVHVPQQGGNWASQNLWYDQLDRYIVVTGDAAGACNIGRSNVELEGMGNPAPADHMPRATGNDATSSPDRDPHAAPGQTGAAAQWVPRIKGIHNDQFKWTGHQCAFRIEVENPPPDNRTVALNVQTWEHNWIESDDLLGQHAVDATFHIGQTVSEWITVAPNPHGDTPYLKVLQNGHKIGESKREGHNSGHNDPAPVPQGQATLAKNFVWNGNVVRFQVEPADAQEVYVDFSTSFEMADLLFGVYAAGSAATSPSAQRVQVVNGWASADAGNISHNISAKVYRDHGLHEKIGESPNRQRHMSW